MEAGALLLLLFAVLGTSTSSSFYGDSISFMPPKQIADETFEVSFHRRLNGRSSCSAQSSFSCEGGVCSNLDQAVVQNTDEDVTGQSRWCQSEGHTTATVTTNQTTISLKDSGCCWVSNVEGKTNWTSHAELDLGIRSDSRSINRCPVTATVSSLRVPQNCFTRLNLLAHDPDEDKVRCRFSADATVPSNFILDENACTLSSTGEIKTGVHVFELMMEDYSTRNITLTYADGTSVNREASDMNSPLCKVKLQFSMEVLPSIPNCEAGHVQPMFLSKTPSHGDVLHATIGQNFQLFVQAQAQHSKIQDLQVSGPPNVTKELRDEAFGKAEVTLSWTPQTSDLYRFVPICFTAETQEAQSEMRCVVVMVTRSSITQGKAIVHCSSNKMTVALEKASMPDIDEDFLKLKDPSCSLTSNGTHILGSMSFNTCGTKLEDKGDFIVFKNEINSFELPDEVIVRRRTVKIDFFCEFPKMISISSFYNLHQSDYIFTESSFGSFGYTFEIFRDNNFTKKVEASAYPVQVKLLEMIYMGIQANSDLPNVTLFVDSCKATPDENPNNALSYDLIKNGCKQDETLVIHPSDATSFNFEVQAFKFNGNYDQVFITCSVILCEPGNPFSRCAQGCLKAPSRRRRRGLASETSSHSITQGPLQFVGPSAAMAAGEERDGVERKNDAPGTVNSPPVLPDTKSGESRGSAGFREVLTSHITTVIFASGFILSLLLLAAVVRHYSRRRNTDDRNVLIESDSEN